MAILHVDDEPMIREVVRRALHVVGVVVVSVDGVSAAKLVLAERRDVAGAFLDVQLGDGNGLELYEWIGEHHPSLLGRIAFLTSIGDSKLFDPLMALGCPVLRKPFELADLRKLAAAWDGTEGAVS